MNKKDIEKEIQKLENQMSEITFWQDKNQAQEILKKLAILKNEKEGLGKYDQGNAIINIISGAGGDDAEDFSAMLLNMYLKYIDKKKWQISFIHQYKNNLNGYKNVSFEVIKNPSTQSRQSGPYGLLKNESGVHRLVRISPFNAKKLRHTSFSLVEVLPKFSKLDESDFVILEKDLKIEFSKSGGPGGQNVNKRETAVRLIHLPTNISVHATEGRSQEQNKEIAFSILRAKIFKKAQEEKQTIEESMKISKYTQIEWGNQIRSYVLHPYKMVKDHRTGVEDFKVDDVLKGELDLFIEAEKNL